MERMSGLDSLFIQMDTPREYYHTIKLHILEPGADLLDMSWKKIKLVFASRLHLVPRLRQRYLGVPLGLNHPVWVDDEDFNLDYHLLRVGCPAPGSNVELCELVSELYSRQLDHSRPLWQAWLIEGLEGGRVALFLMISHAYADGVAVQGMMARFWDTHPDTPASTSGPAWQPRPLPSKWRLLADGLAELPGVFADNLPAVIRGARAGRKIRQQWQDEGRELPPSPGGAGHAETYKTRLSGPHRKFVIHSFQLARFKRIGKAFGATLNDVFLAVTSSAIREDLIRRTGKSPVEPELTSVPFSLIPPAERTREGNFVTTAYALLNVQISDPLERLRACQHSATIMKAYVDATKEANVLASMNLVHPWLAVLLGRLNEASGGDLLPITNVATSNVPGPRKELFIGHSRMVEYYSIGMITNGTTVNLTVWSYGDQMNLCILVDPEVIADPWRMVEAMESGLAELEALVPHEDKPA